MKTLIDKGANANNKDNEGRTPLHYAAKQGYTEIVKILIDKKANIDEKTNNGLTPLHYAAKYGYTEIVEILIDKKANVNEKDNNGWTPLHYAAKYGRTKVVMTLIRNKANVDEKTNNGLTPLHYAAKYDWTEVVKTLIDERANVNEKDNNGWAPLHYAVKYGYTEIVKTLIDKGANVNNKDNNERTPLYLAALENNTEMIKLLMDRGADPLLGNGNVEILKYLVKFIKNDGVEYSQEKKAQQKEKQVDSEYESLKYSLLFNPLTYIIERNKFNDLVSEWSAEISSLTESQRKLNKELLSIFEDLPCCDITRLENFLQGNKGNDDLRFILNLQRGRSKITILHVISSMTDLMVERDTGLAVGKFMDLLLTAEANPNIPDSKGQTPLHYAAYSSCDKVICSLLNKGARNEPDKQGKTPLDVAIDNHNYSIEECFLTNEQKIVKKDLEDTLRSNCTLLQDYFPVLKQFLEEHKKTEDLQKVLNLRDREGKSRIFQEIRGACHYNANYGKSDLEKVEKLLLQVGAIDHKGLDKKKRKKHSLELGTLWNNLISDQQEKLGTFLGIAGAAKSMDELERVVTEAIDSGVKFNLFRQGSLYNKQCENKYSFADYIINKISELKKNSKVVSDIKVASDIVCKLVSKGAVLCNISSLLVIDELEEFEGHKSNMKKARVDYENHTQKFMKVAKSAVSGRVKDAKVDNSTFYLRCSKDSTVKVAEIIEGARSLGFSQESVEYRRDIIKVGKSEVEIITKNGIRNYTDFADGSDIVLTFHTNLGELKVRLHPDKENKDQIRVKVLDQEKWERLKNYNEEIGKNCSLGWLSVNKAIEQGYFERSGHFQRSETMSPSKEVSEKAGMFKKVCQAAFLVQLNFQSIRKENIKLRHS
ncbi:ankyrin repeat domain-containing protein [Candidatus Wolbachia massiliensis]|uniref:Ankyrin repeat domain-containing protein n=2 Tax=Candidatus Wolbachia massiliensis TaxID=1845000 RepID=A0A7L7YL51_9RICK|nr:ankyrin repeat domain-containing protein [Candidatus Wolbachia massiliensis]